MPALNRCSCGRVPHIRVRSTRDDTVVTAVVCPSLSCEAEGPWVEDEERNDEAAAAQWNRHGGRKAA
ncbi:MAG: hypothetical protein WBL20_14385 [Sphingobium sp.]